MMGLVGLMIATIGVDPQVGNTRFMFGQLWLMDGIDFLVLAVALFGVGEVLASVEQGLVPPKVELTIRNLLPTRLDWVRSRYAVLRGTVIGFLIGVLPGAGATIASFIAYAVEKKVSKHPEQFGSGAIEGVAAPEAANNAAATGAMVPMFALGIPGSGTTAVMLGALIMFGLQPGPQLFEKNADLVWGVIASMYVGNAILLALNLPLAGMFATLLRVRYTLLYPVILALCVAGVYSQANSADDLWVMSAFGFVGYFMKKYGFPVAPLVLGLVLEPMLETALRQSMTLSHGSLAIFVTRPISAALIVVTLLVVLAPLIARLFRRPIVIQ
jgi:putative tricarboxylic transport membrane protein